jgi:transcriptional regulator with XRE-family HTH domain
MMKKEDLIKRKNDISRLEKEGHNFEEYQDYLPEAQYDVELATHYMIRDLILDFKQARIKKNMTQEEVATLMETKQTAISRFENYDTKPSIDFLMRYAQALGKELELRLKDESLDANQYEPLKIEPVKSAKDTVFYSTNVIDFPGLSKEAV